MPGTLFVSPQARNDPAYIQLLAQSVAMLNQIVAGLQGGGIPSGILAIGGLTADELDDDVVSILGGATAEDFA